VMVDSKPCSGCGVAKPLTEFHRNGRARDGRQWRCKECSSVQHTAHYAATKEARSEYAREWYKRNRPRAAAVRRAYRLRQYGLTPESFDAMLKGQGGCAICGAVEPGSANWHIDHDHSCCPGRLGCPRCIRGLLCHGCNVMLGMAADSVETLRAGIGYLEDRQSARREA
jgi:hypothetical protein